MAKLLADVVIPCEYGLDPGGKLRIGSKIANELLGKLMVDLASMREESIATACMEPHGARGGSGTPNYDQLEGELGRWVRGVEKSMDDATLAIVACIAFMGQQRHCRLVGFPASPAFLPHSFAVVSKSRVERGKKLVDLSLC